MSSTMMTTTLGCAAATAVTGDAPVRTIEAARVARADTVTLHQRRRRWWPMKHTPDSFLGRTDMTFYSFTWI